jgi:dienelactone hydrolase
MMRIVETGRREGQEDGVDRRRALTALVALALSGCSQGAPGSERKQAEQPVVGWHEVSFDGDADQPDGQRAAIFAPPGSESWPVLVALHGRGEAGRGLDAGARGWRDDYDLDLVRERLEKGTLDPADVHGMLSEPRLAAIRASLAAAPWKGIVVACPYTPVPNGKRPEDLAPFGRFLEKRLLPKVAEVKKGPVTMEATGIDGVSMGGRWALDLGLTMPEVFGAVGAMQAAIRTEEAAEFADRAATVSLRYRQTLRLVSSSDDPFLEPTLALAKELEARHVPHDLVVTGGPHDYIWNRGPGAAEMLVYHERVLRGLSPPS